MLEPETITELEYLRPDLPEPFRSFTPNGHQGISRETLGAMRNAMRGQLTTAIQQLSHRITRGEMTIILHDRRGNLVMSNDGKSIFIGSSGIALYPIDALMALDYIEATRRVVV